jgi:hypothetical protein
MEVSPELYCAVPAGRPVVGETWVEASGKAGGFVDPEDHLLAGGNSANSVTALAMCWRLAAGAQPELVHACQGHLPAACLAACGVGAQCLTTTAIHAT